MKQRFIQSLIISAVFVFSAFLIPQAVRADFSDNFTNTNGTNITTHNSAVYSYLNGMQPAVTIQSNAIAPNASTVRINGHEFADGCITMDWTGNSTNTNMAVRVNSDVTSYYNFLHHNNNGDWLLRGYYGGQYTTIDSGNTSFSGTHTYKLCAIGQYISVYKDGTLFASGTDSGVTASGKQHFYSEGNTLDNLSITVAGGFSDTFTNTNGTDVTTHNSDYTYLNGQQPQITIQSNAIAPNQSTIVVNNHEFADGCISMDWTGNSTNTNIQLRVNSSNNDHYGFLQNNNNGDWLLFGYYGASYTFITSGNTSFSGTHNYKLCAIGSYLYVYKDGSLFTSGTDTGITASGKQRFYSEGNTLDNLSL